MNTLRNFNSLLNSRDRATLGLLAVLMVIGGLFEVLGIGLLFPYVSILQDPSQISSNAYLRMVYDALGFTSTKAFSIALSFGLLAVFVVKGGFNIWMNNAQIRFICALQARLGETLLSDYLSQPYRFFLSANTATLISNLTTALSRMCSGLVQAALTLASEGIVVLGLVGFLIYVNPGFSLGAVLFVGLLSLAFIRLARARVAHYGQQTEVQWVSMIRTVNEAVGSVKEVQTLGRSRYFIDTYANAARVFSWAVGRNMLFSQLARVILETGAVAGMVLLCVFALVLGGFGKNLFSILAVFAFATVRLVPSANRILLSWNNIVYNMSSVDVIASIRAETSQALAKLSSAGTGDRSGTELRLREALRISVESFRYPSNPQFHLRDINVVVKKGQAVAFIGHSGSGKTSLVDLILGLFQDFKGNILVDGHNIRDNIAGWRRHSEHLAAQRMGREQGYRTVALRVSRVERASTFEHP